MTDKGKYLVALFIPVLLLHACTQDRQPCLTPKTAVLIMKSVRKTTDNKVLDTAFNSALLVPVIAPMNKGTYYAKSSNFTVSLSPLSDTCQWLFAADTAAGSAIDTLTFSYNRELKFVSNACGYSHFFSLNTVGTTHNFIDSVTISNKSVTNNVNTTHVQVYIHPRS
jgi:hypothetical protein